RGALESAALAAARASRVARVGMVRRGGTAGRQYGLAVGVHQSGAAPALEGPLHGGGRADAGRGARRTAALSRAERRGGRTARQAHFPASSPADRGRPAKRTLVPSSRNSAPFFAGSPYTRCGCLPTAFLAVRSVSMGPSRH